MFNISYNIKAKGFLYGWKFMFLNHKENKNKTVINDQGFALLGILITVFIIALIGYGVISYSGKKTDGKASSTDEIVNKDIVTPIGQLKTNNKAKSDIEKINQITGNRQQDLEVN